MSDDDDGDDDRDDEVSIRSTSKSEVCRMVG